MAKKSNDLATILQKYSTDKEYEMKDTGIEVFNELWGGGICDGFMYGFYGTPGVGKSSLSLQMVKRRLKDGDKVLIVDVEKSINDFQLQSFGLIQYKESGQLAIATITFFNEYEELMMAIADDATFKFVLVDSVTAIQPYVAKGLTVEDVRPGIRALQASQVQSKIKAQFYLKGIASIMIFQARANLDMTGNMYAPKEKSAAGFTERHLLDVETVLSTSSVIKDEDDRIIGNKVWIECKKNKFTAPFQRRQSSLIFGKGILKRIEVVDRALELGIIIQRGSFFQVPGSEENIRGRKALYDLPSDILKAVQQKIKESV
jgi:recombination protein RecA